MKKSTKTTKQGRLPAPPLRTAFKLDKKGRYHHTVMPSDLRPNATSVTTDRFVPNKSNFSGKPEKNFIFRGQKFRYREYLA